MAATVGARSSQRGQSFWKVVSCVGQWESVSLRSYWGERQTLNWRLTCLAFVGFNSFMKKKTFSGEKKIFLIAVS